MMPELGLAAEISQVTKGRKSFRGEKNEKITQALNSIENKEFKH